MSTFLEKIISLKGKEFNYSFKVKDESYLWSEDKEVISFHALSTSSLLEEIHKCSYNTLKDLLDKDQVSVVSHSCIDHLSSTPYSFKVFIKLKITDVSYNKVHFQGEAFDEINKIATFELTRNIVSKKILRKNLNQKMESINLSGQISERYT
jgi:predicted thioesterase